MYYLDDIPIDIAYKRIKNIHLRIDNTTGDVKVSAPYFVSKRKLNKFLKAKKDWIVLHQNQVKKKLDYQAQFEPKDYVTGERALIWGETYTLKVIPASRWKIVKDDNSKLLYFYVTKSSTSQMRQARLNTWYKEILLLDSQPVFQKYYKLTGLKPNNVAVRFTKSVWGTCNKKTKRIMLNAQLAKKDKKFLDYIVLHELTHLKYSNHGTNFKNFMTQYLPNWTLLRHDLNM